MTDPLDANTRPTVRWTEHGPEPVADVAPVEAPEAIADGPAVGDLDVANDPHPPVATRPTPSSALPADETTSDFDTLRARLTARGLVRTEPSVRIRDVAGPAPEAPHTRIAVYKGIVNSDTEAPVDTSAPGDVDAIEAEPFGPTVLTRCPSCRTTQQVAIEATGYHCRNCDRKWRWGICSSCSHLSLTIARQESWRCTDCGAYSRSWWRTDTATRESQEVTQRKRADAAKREHERVHAVAKRRRWKVILAGVVIIALAGLSALVFSSADTSSAAEQTRATCASWSRLKSDIANGALSAPELRADLTELAASADLADPDVQLAADRVTTAGLPGDATFLVASTALSDACAATRP